MNFNPPNDATQNAAWRSWFAAAGKILNGVTESGTTANRPTKGLYTGRMYFDTTLGKPVWYKTAGCALAAKIRKKYRN